MTQEQFGTTTAIYNKLTYNSRGQLAEMRASTAGGDTTWDRGKIVNDYSDQCSGASCNGTDNNGNLKKQGVFIPSSDTFAQSYEYDSLNRLQSVRETRNGGSTNWQQQYVYDRYGNRAIAQGSTETYGTGIPKPNFTVSTSTNRLGVPSGQSGTMSYDSAGNLTTDTYSAAAVTRAYDAENRMTSETQASNYVAGSYSYDGDGRRVKRTVNATETWQVYGLGGELLAEYAANTAASTPQKEYGYRNGQLLVTITAGAGWGSPPVLHDNPLVVGETTVQARHITELRTAINALRAREGMAAYSWTTSATTSDYINANPIIEMRTALDQALGVPPSGYSAGLAQNQPIKAVHIQELRDRLLAAWGIDIRWLVTDQLGTPRMVFDQSGSLSGVSRHDYLPFGEELYAGTGGRSTTQGYSVGDGARQKFTLKERDNETGLDFFKARYYASMQGRFTSADPVSVSLIRMNDPQQLNLYSYTRNNPLAFIDDDGKQTKKPKVTVEQPVVVRKPYDVKGANAKEAIEHSTKIEGFAGGTQPQWNAEWSYDRVVKPVKGGYSATVTITAVDVKTTITVETPNWVDSSKAPETEQKTWTNFVDEVNKHEDGHVAIDSAAATDIGNAIAETPSVTARGRTPVEALGKAESGLNADAKSRDDAVRKQADEKNQQYDKDTDHGRKKPDE